MSEWVFVSAAYAVTWVVLLGYAMYLNRRIRRARELVERSMDSGEVQR
jgi:CcmD family protein